MPSEIDEETRQQLLAIDKQMQVTQKVAEELRENDPSLPYITSIIMAGDKLAADRSWEWLKTGYKSFIEAQVFVGSYYRLDFWVRAMEQGFTTLERLLEELPELWRASDPDDTDPRYLRLWKKSWERNGRKYIRDGRPIPSRTKMLTIYRGQDKDVAFGIAWTLDPKIARKFANGASLRVKNRGGIVYRAKVPRTKVMAYLTLRGESEIIIDPKDIE